MNSLYIIVLLSAILQVSARLLALSTVEVDEKASIYELSTVDGSASLVVELDTRASFVGLAYLDGVVYGTDVVDDTWVLQSIDLNTGVTTFVSDQDGSIDWHDLTANTRTGLLYSHDFEDDERLKTVDPHTGVVKTISGPQNPPIAGSAYHAKTNTLYGTFLTDLYAIDVTDGSRTLIGSHGIGSEFQAGLAFENDVLYMVRPSGLYTVDLSTGAATLIGEHGLELDGLTSDGKERACVCCRRFMINC